MRETPIQDILNESMKNLRDLVGAETIIGKPIEANGNTIIPVSKVSFGFAAGGSDMPTSKPKDLFGGGSGGGVTVTPIAFLVITASGDVRLMQVAGDSNNAGRALNMIPEVVDKVVGMINQKKNGASAQSEMPSEADLAAAAAQTSAN